MPEEVLKLSDAELDWLDSIAKQFHLTPVETAQTAIAAAIEQQRKPEEPCQ